MDTLIDFEKMDCLMRLRLGCRSMAEKTDTEHFLPNARLS